MRVRFEKNGECQDSSNTLNTLFEKGRFSREGEMNEIKTNRVGILDANGTALPNSRSEIRSNDNNNFSLCFVPFYYSALPGAHVPQLEGTTSVRLCASAAVKSIDSGVFVCGRKREPITGAHHQQTKKTVEYFFFLISRFTFRHEIEASTLDCD